jgi:hypothetical protein
MARRWTFGTDKFGTLVTAAAPHLLDSGQLQVAQNVSRDLAGALSPTKTDLFKYQLSDTPTGMKVVRFGGANHVMASVQWHLSDNGVEIGASIGPVHHRFVCDGDRVYAFGEGQGKVWDGVTLRNHGPLGSDMIPVYGGVPMGVYDDDSTAVGVTGKYKWAASYRVTLESGVVLESRLYPMTNGSFYGYPSYEDFSDSATAKTLTASDGVMMYIQRMPQATIDAWCGDLGTGKVEGVFWRTKAGGVEYWQNSVVSQSDVVGNASTAYSQHDTVLDANLGALYVDANKAHSTPPQANLAVFCQRRLFVAIKGQRKLYFSGIDQYDYFAPTATVDCEEVIEGLAVMGENVAVVTSAGIRLWSPVDAVGQWSNSGSTVGTTYDMSLVQTDGGLLFARDDGLYLFDGVSSRRVSAPIDPTWVPGTWRGACTNGRGFFSDGMSVAIEFKFLNGVFEWSTSDANVPYPATLVSEDPTDNGIWIARYDGTISLLHGGTGLNPSISQTKEYGDGNVRHWDRLTVDFEGTVSAVVTTNRGATQTVVLTATDRLRTREMLAAEMIGELCSVTFTGTGTIYGVELETT